LSVYSIIAVGQSVWQDWLSVNINGTFPKMSLLSTSY